MKRHDGLWMMSWLLAWRWRRRWRPRDAAPAMHGKADPAAVVQRDHVRFTVLTPRIIRMEWSPDGHFVDAPSQVFVDREQPVPAFTTTSPRRQAAHRHRVAEPHLHAGQRALRRTATSRSARKDFKTAFDWHPGTAESGNLKGTARTLDRYRGDVQLGTGKKLDLGEGLISRQGWHLIDDSKSFLFDDSAWRWVAEAAVQRLPGSVLPRLRPSLREHPRRFHQGRRTRADAAAFCLRLLVVALLELLRQRVPRPDRQFRALPAFRWTCWSSTWTGTAPTA